MILATCEQCFDHPGSARASEIVLEGVADEVEKLIDVLLLKRLSAAPTE